MKLLRILGFVLCAGTLAGQAVASGGGGGGGGFGGGSSSYGSAPVQPRVTDPIFEHGKAVFKGRIVDMEFCLTSEATEEGLEKVKKKSIKPYRATSYQALANVLVNCEKPEQYAAQALKRNDFTSMLYYLDKRFNLRLGS